MTTTVVHKDPDPSNGVLIYPYMYLFSTDNVKLSAFQYSLTSRGNATPPVALGEMKDRWQNVRQDHTYLVSPMYRGELSNSLALSDLTLPVGINQTIPVTINMSFAIPAYECWLLVVIPVCYPREYKSDNHMPIDSLMICCRPRSPISWRWAVSQTAEWGKAGTLSSPRCVMPMAMACARLFNGLDPNDAVADGDGDGLTDRFELEQQTDGTLVSPFRLIRMATG